MNNLVKVGKIVGVFGIRGEMKFENYCDGFSSFANIKKIYDGSGNIYELKYLKAHKNIGILKLAGIEKIEQAELMRNYELFVLHEDLPIEEDEFFLDDIIGFEGFSEEGQPIGKLENFQEIGHKLLYIFEEASLFEGGVPKGRREYMIPSELVQDIDFENKKIIIDIIEGILDINKP